MASKVAQNSKQEETAAGYQPAKLKDFDQMRAILRSSKSKEGQDLFAHLTDIMNHISTHCPDQAMDKLEEISYLIKNKENIDMSQFLKVAEDRKYSQADKCLAEQTKDAIIKARKFFEVSSKGL